MKVGVWFVVVRLREALTAMIDAPEVCLRLGWLAGSSIYLHKLMRVRINSSDDPI